MRHEPHETPVFVVKMDIQLLDLGLMDYGKAHEVQLQYVEKRRRGENDTDYILLTEHPPVFTLGRNGSLSGLIRSRTEILRDGIDIVSTERGGNITYHGPGQLVVYPIVNLRTRKLTVTDFVFALEEVMISTAAAFGVIAGRDERNRGVWVGNDKLGSVGIRVRHSVSFHGLAINVNVSLEPFRWIQPCGLSGIGVTSLERERGRPLVMEQVKTTMRACLTEIFAGVNVDV